MMPGNCPAYQFTGNANVVGNASFAGNANVVGNASYAGNANMVGDVSAAKPTIGIDGTGGVR